jgi:ArsR family metal-binding transcriptional regulator
MLIEKYDLQVLTPPCDPGAERFTAKAKLITDIREVLPYLNATLHGAVYFPDAGAGYSAPALIWKKAGHNVAFHPYEIAVSNAVDRESAQKELDGLIVLVNRTWKRRAEITPSYEVRRRPTVMDAYKLLPQTNCKQCGQPTCYTFALKLVASQKKLDDCLPLFGPQYADKLAALQDIVIDAPTIA